MFFTSRDRDVIERGGAGIPLPLLLTSLKFRLSFFLSTSIIHSDSLCNPSTCSRLQRPALCPNQIQRFRSWQHSGVYSLLHYRTVTLVLTLLFMGIFLGQLLYVLSLGSHILCNPQIFKTAHIFLYCVELRVGMNTYNNIYILFQNSVKSRCLEFLLFHFPYVAQFIV
jgi:hypothetical protein